MWNETICWMMSNQKKQPVFNFFSSIPTCTNKYTRTYRTRTHSHRNVREQHAGKRIDVLWRYTLGMSAIRCVLHVCHSFSVIPCLRGRSNERTSGERTCSRNSEITTNLSCKRSARKQCGAVVEAAVTACWYRLNKILGAQSSAEEMYTWATATECYISLRLKYEKRYSKSDIWGE